MVTCWERQQLIISWLLVLITIILQRQQQTLVCAARETEKTLSSVLALTPPVILFLAHLVPAAGASRRLLHGACSV